MAGQLHRYALGPPCSLLARAPYDQFLTTDYNPLLRDLQHHVVDAETQLPPHVLTGKPLLLHRGVLAGWLAGWLACRHLPFGAACSPLPAKLLYCCTAISIADP